MPAQNHIDIRIIVDGQPLQEHLEPEAIDEGNKRVRYVEVKAGQEFAAHVTLKAGFDLQWTEAVMSKVRIDDMDIYFGQAFDKRYMQHRRGILLHDYLGSVDTAPLKDDITGRMESCPLPFGVLGITDQAPVNLTLKPENIQRIGSIRVEVYRAVKVKLNKPYFWNGERPKILDELLEKALKGRHLKNNVKLPNGPPTEEPQAWHFEYNPMHGREGTIYQFEFLYRTRKILQSVGCIPRSPSPSPDLQLALERAEDTIRLEQQRAREANLENLRLREELARSQSRSRPTSIITENDPFTPATSCDGSTARGTPTPQSSYIKRESTNSQVLEARITRPQPPLFTGITRGQKRARAEEQELSEDSNPKRARRDLSIADEVDEIVRSVEQQDDNKARQESGSVAGSKRKRPVEEDDDEIVELPPKKAKPFAIVDLTVDD